MIEVPRFLEGWSWVAGILATLVALATVAWQLWPIVRRSWFSEWKVLDRAFHGVRVGAPVASLHRLPMQPVQRSGHGKIKLTKWRLVKGNELSATYDTEQDRIVYAELDWDGQAASAHTHLREFKFGETTLDEIRKELGSNGFSYSGHMMFKTPEGIITFNAFELKHAPSTILVFVSRMLPAPAESDTGQAQRNDPGRFFRLVAIAVADEVYLDELWGSAKLYDPRSVAIAL